MKKKLIAAVAATFAVLPMFATAQSQNFVGFDLGLDVGFKSTSAKLSSANSSLDSVGSTDWGWALTGGYTMPLGQSATLGFVGSYDLSTTEFAKLSDPSTTVKAKMKDHYSIGLEPGWVVSNNVLVYGKLNYHSANFSLDYNSSSGKQDFKAFGYGAGVKVLMSKNVFVRLSVERVDYDSKTVSGVTMKPSDTTGMIGLGWKF